MNAPANRAISFPRAPLIAAAALLIVSVAVVASVRWSGVDIRSPDAPATRTLALRFEDRPDGRIAVLDARSGQEIHAIVGENGFIRGTLRGLARERKRAGGGPEQAFELIARADGRFTLQDPVTGRRVDLESFGPQNASKFAALMSLSVPTDSQAGTAAPDTTVSGMLTAPRPQ
jgi:putative photosynthetic complex assembly protein